MPLDRFLPHEALRPYISFYTVGENYGAESYRVIPRPAVVMGVQYKGAITVVNSDGERRLTASGLTGVNDSTRMYRSSADTGTVLIEFTPSGAARFFDFSISQIAGDCFSLEDLTSRVIAAELEEKLAGAPDNRGRLAVIDVFFLARLGKGHEDALVAAAIDRIRMANGNLRIGELSGSLFIGHRQLEKRFLRVVGCSPKKFSSLVRLDWALRHRNGMDNLTQLAHAAGYFDQAHFIKDFSSFLGLPPEQFFSGKSPGPQFR